MRQGRTIQASIFDLFAGHEIGCELKAMSQWLDEHRALLSLVAEDLRQDGVKETGRQGLPAEAVLRCALLKQYRQLSYQEPAFYLEDSMSFRAFARLPWSWSPKKSVLHKTISAIRAETWEEITACERQAGQAGKWQRRAAGQHGHRGAAARAKRQQPAVGRSPRDGASAEAGECFGWRGLSWRDHRRAAKKRDRAIQFTRGRPRRVQLYRELIKIARATLAYLRQATAQLSMATNPVIELWQAKVRHDQPLIIAQSERRVLAGEPVPAGDKLVSLVRAPCRHHRQGRPRGRVRPQAQPDHRQERLNPRLGDRSGQPRGQRAAAAHAGAPQRVLWASTAPGGCRWQLCQPQQSAPGQSPWHPRRGLPRRAVSRSKTWSAAAGSIASCGTSAPASRPAYHA